MLYTTEDHSVLQSIEIAFKQLMDIHNLQKEGVTLEVE